MFILIPFQQVRVSTYAPSKYAPPLFSLKGRGVGGNPPPDTTSLENMVSPKAIRLTIKARLVFSGLTTKAKAVWYRFDHP